MEGNTFFIFEIMEKETGKCFAYVETIPNCYNLVGYTKETSTQKVLSMNACKTLKEANKIANQWNEGYKKKGIYMY